MEAKVEERSWLSSLEELFVKILDDFEARTGVSLYETRSRTGIFAPALVMWLMISERARGRRSLSEALSSLGEGEGNRIREKNKRSEKEVFSQNTGGLCRARERLSLETVHAVSRYLSEYLIRQSSEEYRWHGRTVVLVDGTTMVLNHTEAILREYRPIKNQHKRVHNPQLLCLCAVELFTGIALTPQFAPYRGEKLKSELQLYHQMVGDLPKQSLIVADRFFGSFSVVHEAHRKGHQVLIRLKESQAVSIVGKRATDYVEAVTWRPSRQILKRYPDISSDDVLKGRVIRHTVQREGYRPLVLYFFTSSPERAEELVELYLQRERIENDIRALKYLMGLEMLSAKSPDIIAKELLLTFSSSNLMRSILAKAASKLNLKPRQFSFKRATMLTQAFGNRLRRSQSEAEHEKIVNLYLVALTQVKHPNRKKRRLEPRKCARHKSRFPLMKKSRKEEQAHALALAKKFGHRNFVYPWEKH